MAIPTWIKLETMKHKAAKADKPPRPWWQRWLKQKFSLCIDSRQELFDELHSAHKKGLIKNDSLGMIEGVLQIEQREARDIMIPRSNITFLHRDDSFEQLVDKAMQSRHSRYPVYDENRDDFDGILLTKDLLSYVGKEASFDIDDILLPAYVIPESKQLQSLLTDFRKTRKHMAIVINEYSSVSGIVTIEDVLEQIVGEIDDEHDFVDDKVHIKQHKGNHYSIDALTPIEEFNDYFNAELKTDLFDTIGGVVMNSLGRIPKQGEELKLGDFLFQVTRSDGRRILSMDLIVEHAVAER